MIFSEVFLYQAMTGIRVKFPWQRAGMVQARQRISVRAAPELQGLKPFRPVCPAGSLSLQDAEWTGRPVNLGGTAAECPVPYLGAGFFMFSLFKIMKEVFATVKEMLELLETNAKLTAEDIAVMLSMDVEEVKKKIKEMEDNKTILGYITLVNWKNAGRRK
jgi:hypothetical protein